MNLYVPALSEYLTNQLYSQKKTLITNYRRQNKFLCNHGSIHLQRLTFPVLKISQHTLAFHRNGSRNSVLSWLDDASPNSVAIHTRTGRGLTEDTFGFVRSGMVKEVKQDLYISLVVMVKSFVWMHKPALSRLVLYVYSWRHTDPQYIPQRACQERYSIIHRGTTKQVYNTNPTAQGGSSKKNIIPFSRQINYLRSTKSKGLHSV